MSSRTDLCDNVVDVASSSALDVVEISTLLSSTSSRTVLYDDVDDVPLLSALDVVETNTLLS